MQPAHSDTIEIEVGSDCRIRVGSSFDGRALSTKAVVLDASGGCAAKVTVSGGITGSASGGTTVSVFGNPTAAQLETSGASHVEYVK